MNQKTIGILVGSLRKKSYSKQVAEILSAMMPENIKMQIVDIGNLPIFNQDFEEEDRTPKEWTAFRAFVKPLDGFLFVTPEYNRSVPPVLKNAIDIGSRPPGQSLWDGKPGAIVSVSPGKLGGFCANQHLRQSLALLNVCTMQQPEACIGNIADLLNEAGALKDDETQSFLQNFASEFANWINAFDD